ncbi:cell volume regulation protein A [Peteryoungia aggregata LMG 23059]|uniref:Cell volume regulation protein A n=1 Tax=Peteryoungia aggregata LMG 23059 TaxID=1368425 RepID=A0ABU0G2P9_9HYPH|nr:potassium/proton antiporter [Peteryoungia aggregata]MDQ0419031.1 cell volume regulation protein A [Peteryoungia aggregata LMG 23059]
MSEFYAVTLVATALVFLAAFSSLIAFRFGAPLLLLFLTIGLGAGVDGLGIDFSNFPLAYVVGSLALAVVLFDSGYGTSLQSFRLSAAPALTLATLGVLLTTLLVGVAAHFLFGFSYLEGMLLGAILGSTDAAAVFFLLRIGGINIRDRVRSSLEVESGTNDPMAIFLAIALVELISNGSGAGGLSLELLRLFVEQMGIGLVLGLAGGASIAFILRRLHIEQGLAPIFMLALALMIFAFTGMIGGSGFLAVYVAGIYAGSRKLPSTVAIKRFQDGMTWLAQIIMFLVLGLLATPSQFPEILLPAVLLALFLVFVARPIAVWLCLLPFDFTQRETGFIAWVGLRGAVSILLGIVPVIGSMENGQVFFNTAFIVVMISLVLQGWTIKPLARRLGLIIPPRIGAIDKVELDLPGSANHELLAYRVVAGCPVLRGERIPRWAMPSLVIRDGKSMRYQYAGRLRENDQVYLFIAPSYSRLLDRLFATEALVEEDDTEFFGTFAISPATHVHDLDEAYGPLSISDIERGKTVAELITQRVGGRADYADRVRLGTIVLIVRDIDENGHIASVGVSMEPVEPATTWPIFLSIRELARAASDYLRHKRAAAGGKRTGEK